jgi:protein-disulfide isomerase
MTLREKIDSMLTWILAACAITVTIFVLRRELRPPVDQNAAREPVEVKDWRKYAAGEKRVGPINAPVTIVEFSDFQCPFCSQLFRSLNELRQIRGTDFAIVYRNFPLPIHPEARSAAIAAECAAADGRFAAYHDFLFQHQDSLGTIPWTTVAARVGVADTAGFRNCLTSSKAARALREDSVAGAELNITGTPTIIVNGWMVAGARPKLALDSLITKELQRARGT